MIRVQCDWEDYAFIEQLNKTAFKMNADRYFRFVPCKKSLLINRIDHISIILGNRELSVLPSLQGLKRELLSATWEEKQERLVKQDDHLIDAFSYALWDTMRDKKFMEKKFLYNANNRLNG